MDDEQLLELLTVVLEKSRAGLIAWEAELFSSGFVAKVSGTPLSVKVFAKDDGGDASHYFQLRNKDNEVLGNIGPDPWGDRHEVKELYNLARRKALNVDESIRSALNALGRL